MGVKAELAEKIRVAYIEKVNGRFLDEILEEWDDEGEGYFERFLKVRWYKKWIEWEESMKWN